MEKTWGTVKISKYIEEGFIDVLDPKRRLGNWDSNDKSDAVEMVANKLFVDEPEEIRISEVFRRAFGVDLILNRSRSGGAFHIGDRKKLPPHKKRLTPDFLKFIRNLPLVSAQGSGMRSFARIALQILTSWKSVVVIDEPELFLHPPQVRHLARLIASDANPQMQLFIATHNENFVRGVLDVDNERVTVIRLSRSGDQGDYAVLNSDDIKALWEDPLFRTSNVLSALFHDGALLLEGESDVRFLQTLMGTIYGNERLPDVGYYSCNGKSKIGHIAKALRGVKVPVLAVVDLDIFRNRTEFLSLFETLGGDPSTVAADVAAISNAVEQKKNFLTGRQFLSEIDLINANIDPKQPVPESAVGSIRELLKRTSPWVRVKQDGVRGLNDADATQAFRRVFQAGADHGLLVIAEGELEGFCRSISRTNKSEWLSEVLKRDLVEDPDLKDAREFAHALKMTFEKVVG